MTTMWPKKGLIKGLMVSAIALAIAALLAVSVASTRRAARYMQAIKQAEWSLQVARSDDSVQRVEAQALRLRASEIAAINTTLAAEVEGLKISNRRLAAAAAVQSVVHIHDTAYIRDTLVFVQRADTAYIDTLSCLRWSDAWTKMEACWRPADTAARVEVDIADTLLLTIRRNPRWRFLGLKLGTKGYTAAVRHTCPHVHTENVLIIK